MFRIAVSVARCINPFMAPKSLHPSSLAQKTFSTLSPKPIQYYGSTQKLLDNRQLLDIYNGTNTTTIRTVTKFSMKRGKRKSVKAPLLRFFRLEWGAWIRPKVGRNKKMWKKSMANKLRLKHHVLCNATQSTMLDKMVTKFWKKPKYYVDDPYRPYHTREEFPITRRTPLDRN